MTDGRKNNGGHEKSGRKAGGRNKTTLMAMQFREQILASSYSPLVVMQKNIEWTQGEAEKLEAALAELDLANMPGEKIEALNEARRQAITLRTRANDFAAQAAPYVQPKPQPIDDPITLDIRSLATAEDIAKAADSLVLAMASGDISPEQAGKVSAVIESRRKAIEMLEIDRRLIALEGKRR